MKLTQRATLIQEWVMEAADHIRQQFQTDIQVKTKSNRKDLVTNVDQEIEVFFREKIAEAFPEDLYIGEEKMGDNPSSLDGNVWIVDPIDGTANFVMQRNHFAIMVAFYVNGEGMIGAIYDVINDDYFEAIAGQGIKRNGQSFIPPFTDKSLSDSLLAINGTMVMKDINNVQELITESMGLRIYGSAGIELIAIIKGEIAAYVSPHLQPWDIAAGMVFAKEMGVKVSQFDGNSVDLTRRNGVIVAYPSAYDRMIQNFK